MEAAASVDKSGVWDPDAVVGNETSGSTRPKTGEVGLGRVSGMEAVGFSLAAGLTAAFSAEGPAFLDLALSGAADAFPEEAAAFWGTGSAFGEGVNAFTVGVALGAGVTIGAEAGTNGSGA